MPRRELTKTVGTWDGSILWINPNFCSVEVGFEGWAPVEVEMSAELTIGDSRSPRILQPPTEKPVERGTR